MEARKDAGKHAKSEQRKGVKDTTRDQIKNYHYRTVKFVLNDEEQKDLTDFTKKIYSEIKDDPRVVDDGGLSLSESEYVRIYESFVQESLGSRRQYTQTGLLEAMIGKSSKFGQYSNLFVFSASRIVGDTKGDEK